MSASPVCFTVKRIGWRHWQWVGADADGPFVMGGARSKRRAWIAAGGAMCVLQQDRAAVRRCVAS